MTTRSILTRVKNNNYKFKNKVDLTNRETFGYHPQEGAVNNELYVYLNNTLGDNQPVPITYHNLGYDINETIKLFWDDRVYTDRVQRFNDPSIFNEDSNIVDNQPILTDYIDYKGNIFELIERVNNFVKDKIVDEKIVIDKYLDLFDEEFNSPENLLRISNYIFNLTSFSNENVNKVRYLNNDDVAYDFNRYFRMETTESMNGKEMFAMGLSNSIRTPRIYYKRIETENSTTLYENKFLFPLYLTRNNADVLNTFGLTVIRNLANNKIVAGRVKQSVK